MKKPILLLALSSLAMSPAEASVRDAALFSSSEQAQARTSLFAGATYRVQFGGRGEPPRSRASLKLSGMTIAPGASKFRFGEGVEVAGKAGAPVLSIAGRDAGKIGERANLSTGATVAIVVVGAVVVAGVVAALLIDERLDRQNTE